MTKFPMLKIAASGFALTACLSGCALFSGGDRPDKYTASAEASLAKGDAEKAVEKAEQAVMLAPRDAAVRELLAQSYMKAGRFASAETAFNDVVELDAVDARVAINLALAQIAQAKADKAIDTLNRYRAIIPAGDYGLALALAGQASQGARVIENDIRDGNNTVKSRQNLALAYALDNRWQESRTMARQDLSGNQTLERMQQWAIISERGAYQQRVASLLGVNPIDDRGQPQALALANFPENPAMDVAGAIASGTSRMANAVETDLHVPAIPTPSLAAVELPASHASAPAAPAAAAMSVPAPLVAAPSGPAKVAAKPTPPRAVKPRVAGDYVTGKTKMASASVQPVANGSYVVQLGAFSSVKNAEAGWDYFGRRYRDLKGFEFASSTVTSKGRTLYRVAAAGFGTAKAAREFCRGIKVKGGNCIVRQVGGSGSTKFAARR